MSHEKERQLKGSNLADVCRDVSNWQSALQAAEENKELHPD